MLLCCSTIDVMLGACTATGRAAKTAHAGARTTGLCNLQARCNTHVSFTPWLMECPRLRCAPPSPPSRPGRSALPLALSAHAITLIFAHATALSHGRHNSPPVVRLAAALRPNRGGELAGHCGYSLKRGRVGQQSTLGTANPWARCLQHPARLALPPILRCPFLPIGVEVRVFLLSNLTPLCCRYSVRFRHRIDKIERRKLHPAYSLPDRPSRWPLTGRCCRLGSFALL